MVNLDKEQQILLLGSKYRIHKEDMLHLQSLFAAGVDWDILFSLSRRHKVFPRLWKNLSAGFSDVIPAEIVQKQKALFRDHCFFCLAMTKELFNIIDLFHRHQIFHIPYKGPVLAAFLYGDIAQRSYGDLDILIQSSDLPRICPLLTANGYQAEIPLLLEQMHAYAAVEDDVVFVHKSGTRIEFHWELSGRYLLKPMGAEWMRPNLSLVQIQGRSVPIFSLENLLIYFCLHGTKHQWQQLDLIACVAELLMQQKDIDFECLVKTVSQLKCRRMVFVGISLARDLYQLTLPQRLNNAIIEDKKVALICTRLLQEIWCSRSGGVVPNEMLADERFSSLRFDIRDTKWDAIRYALRLLFCPSRAEWVAVKLPGRLLFLYWLIRPVRIVAAFIKRWRG